MRIVCRIVSTVSNDYGDAGDGALGGYWHGLDAIPADLGPTVATIGVFDGVHRGHRALIGSAVAAAREAGVPSVLITLDPNPKALFAPAKAPAQLTDLPTRAELARAAGIDHVLVLPFTRELAGMEPEEFVRVVLHDALHARSVHVGENFTYGHKAAGTAETLPVHCAEHGMAAVVVDLLEEGDHGRVSSTRVRGLLAEGDVAAAGELLGHPYMLSGEVVRGQGRGGSQLGFPTANLGLDPEVAVPADGVYACRFRVTPGPERADADPDGDMELGAWYPAATSVGTNTTFGDTARTVEAHVIGRDADLYGLRGSLEFVGRIRGMVTFDGAEALIERMHVDVDEALEMLGEPPRPAADGDWGIRPPAW